MKKEEIPQDPGALSKITKEVCYAVDESGQYSTSLSDGWEVKASALDVAWKDVEQRIKSAKQRVANKEASPLLYFMELHVMDIAIVSAYTGIWKWQVKKHLRYAVFEKLSASRLQKYADLFEVSVSDLKNMTTNET
ncbi:MAG: hypothetical protein Q8918_05615 [Bacteroidota bacterium]|nr:hypothetical protein [Bacteroidota bacterium]MDP4212923.1 hypothetical protein [Bacteroidota bacterium]MDP4249574.1 hypothetical protein [Bacteroidota bacterium]